MGVVNAYLNSLDVEFATKERLRIYLDLVKQRADGEAYSCYAYVCTDIINNQAHSSLLHLGYADSFAPILITSLIRS